MNKQLKIGFFVLVPISVVLLIMIMILSYFEEPEVEVVTVPQSGLSNSVFVSQNMSYMSNEALTTEHPFTTVPYTVDVMDSSKASVDGGTVYTWGDYYLYLSEIPLADDLEPTIKTQLCDILLYGSSPENISIEEFITQSGYVNGFSATYHGYKLTLEVENGTDITTYLLLYELCFDEIVYADSPSKLIVGAMTPVYSTDSLASCKMLIDAVVHTFYYDASLAKKIENRKRLEEHVTQQESSDYIEPVQPFEPVDELIPEVEEESAEEGIDAPVTGEKEISRSVLISDSNGTVTVEWEPSDVSADVILTSIDKSVQVAPAETAPGEVVFSVEDFESGVYIVTVSGDEPLSDVSAIFQKKSE